MTEAAITHDLEEALASKTPLVIGVVLVLAFVTAALWWPALKLDLGTARGWNGKLARRIVGFGRWINDSASRAVK